MITPKNVQHSRTVRFDLADADATTTLIQTHYSFGGSYVLPTVATVTFYEDRPPSVVIRAHPLKSDGTLHKGYGEREVIMPTEFDDQIIEIAEGL